MLFNRGFVLRYALPAAIFFGASIGIVNGFGLLSDIASLNEVGILLGILFFGIASWAGGACLFMMKMEIRRFMEGYGKWNPARLFLFVQKERYARFNKGIAELDRKFRESIARKEVFPLELKNRRSGLMLQLAIRFPDNEQWVLPTAFGNTIRAFQVYSRVMYGLEFMPGLARLLMVIPKEYRELADEAAIRMDFWVNIWMAGLLVIAEYMGIAFYAGEWRMSFVPLSGLAAVWIASRMARNAANDWAEWAKSAFDVFLPELRSRLGLSVPETMEQERALWMGFSQVIIYRSPSSLADMRDKWGAKGDASKPPTP